MWKVFVGTLLGAPAAAVTMLVMQGRLVKVTPVGMTYAELAATLLSAVSALLACLGFFIAVLAVLGWSQFRGLVRKSATDTAKSHIDTRLKQGDLRTFFETAATEFLNKEFESGNLRRLVEQRVDQIVYGGAAERAASTSRPRDEEEETDDG